MSNEIEFFNRFLHLATRHCERIIRSEKKINTPLIYPDEENGGIPNAIKP